MIIALLCGLVLAAFVLRAFRIVGKEGADRNRGSDRKDGFHVIHAEYSSGISGHHTTYKVPCDPDEYARFFVPQKTDSKQ